MDELSINRKFDGYRSWFLNCREIRDDSVQAAYNLGFDPASNKFNSNEAAAGQRLELQLGIKFTRDPSGAGDWVDSTGKVYDAVGPAPTQYFNWSAP